MSKKPKSRFKPYVKHPRYGDKPRYSGINVPLDEILRAHWSLNAETLFPETVIPADTSKQNYSISPRSWYVDIEKQCRQCRRWFIFYALEQRYWFETLGFYVDAIPYVKPSWAISRTGPCDFSSALSLKPRFSA